MGKNYYTYTQTGWEQLDTLNTTAGKQMQTDINILKQNVSDVQTSLNVLNEGIKDINDNLNLINNKINILTNPTYKEEKDNVSSAYAVNEYGQVTKQLNSIECGNDATDNLIIGGILIKTIE